MSATVDNTPPVIRTNGGVPPTLRDQFAMAALTGLVPLWNEVDVGAKDPREEMVTEAYAIADAMLIVRLR